MVGDTQIVADVAIIGNNQTASIQVPTDIVIDTNVLMHASNDTEQRQEDSVKLITYLLSSTELICIDEGFDFRESSNKSYVGYEYLRNLKNGMIGYAFLTFMAQNKRISEVSRSVDPNLSRKINQCMSNNHDRVFIKVTINSKNRKLITHDFTDFSDDKRKHLRKICNIDIIVAKEIPLQ